MNDYFLYVGNAYPHKNLIRLISAVNLLKVNLYIASSRDVFTKRLEKNRSKYVKLLGFVPDNKLSDLYKNSIAFIFPSLSEGFGLPGIEAIESGTLVLASDIPVFREIYENHALYFDPLNIHSIAEAMKKVITINPNQRKKIIFEAKEFIKKYSWQKMARETLSVYENLIS